MYCWNESCPVRGSLGARSLFAAPEPLTFKAASWGAADALIEHLGLRRRIASEARDLYSPHIW
jgi:hypothetical protein